MYKHSSLALLLVFISAARADKPPPAKPAPARVPQTELERLEKREAYEKVISSLKDVEVALDNLTRTRKLKCLKAFGSEAFCECWNAKLAVGLDFDGYIAVITRTKEELKYDTFTKDDKALVDSAIATRNACAK
jgi:hypothetical protein